MERNAASAAIRSMSATAAVVMLASLHARPAGKLARAAAGFSSMITIEHAGKAVNPTGILALMGLGATIGATVTITAHGPDAEDAVRTLADILNNAE